MRQFGLYVAAFAAAGVMAQGVVAQELNKKVTSDEYVRNSVCLIMMEDASVPQKDVLREAFLHAEWNPKYNNHNLDESLRVIDPTAYTLTAEDEAAFNLACTPTEQYLNILETGGTAPKQTYYNEAMNQILRQLMATQAQTVDTVIKLNVARLANKYLLENGVAKRLADGWFIGPDGQYTDSIALKRGMLNVSADESEVAAATEAGDHYLMRQIDLAELVGNTFVVVTRFGYKPKDALVADIMLPMYAAAEFDPSGYGKMGLKVAEVGVKAGLGAGYYVTVDSYLFRLRWNDNIAERFNELWDNETGAFKLDAYNASDLFSLQFIGNERAWAKTKAGIFTDKDENELIRLAAADAVDGVLAKFERKYDEFKTKTPLIVHEGTDKKGRPVRTYAARIGTRDGLEGGEVFEVLEKKIEMKDSVERVTYVKKGELTVDKKNVWDNSYSTEAGAPSEENKTGETLLVGKSKDAYYEGLLLRMKTKKK